MRYGMNWLLWLLSRYVHCELSCYKRGDLGYDAQFGGKCSHWLNQ